MNTATRIVAAGTALIGVAFAGWGPVLFGALTGARIPQPIAGDATAMSIWSGLALLRVFGAGLIVLGALLAAMTVADDRVRTVYRALGVSAALGLLLTIGQAVAIWTNPLSLLIAVPFGAVMLLGVRGGWFSGSGRLTRVAADA
jgi:hypothetical protein